MLFCQTRLKTCTAALLCAAASLALGSCSIFRLGTYATDAFLGEPDPELASDALPTFIKVSQTLLATDPNHQGNAVSLASLYLLYGTGYLEAEAYYLEDSDYYRWLTLRTRSRALYIRAIDLLRPFVEKKSPAFFTLDFGSVSGASDPVRLALKPFGKKDAPLLFYASAAIFAAFSSNPLDFDISSRLPAALAMLERALELDPDYGDGSIHELAFSVYASMPPEMGGGMDKALESYESAMRASGGLSASLYVSRATLICAPAGDKAGFIEAISKALSLGAEASPSRALLNAIARRKASRLLEQIDMYFYEEEGETDR